MIRSCKTLKTMSLNLADLQATKEDKGPAWTHGKHGNVTMQDCVQNVRAQSRVRESVCAAEMRQPFPKPVACLWSLCFHVQPHKPCQTAITKTESELMDSQERKEVSLVTLGWLSAHHIVQPKEHRCASERCSIVTQQRLLPLTHVCQLSQCSRFPMNLHTSCHDWHCVF